MATTFAEMRKQQSKQFDDLRAQAKKTLEDKGYEKDDRFWRPTYDKAGRAQALIRFLPPCDGEAAGFVRLYEHYFKGPGGWYKEYSRTTIGEADPVHQLVRRLWESRVEGAQERARALGRRKKIISNIYVKRDPANPDAEKGVFLYSYPNVIFETINTAMNGPSEEDKLSADEEVETFPVFSMFDSRDFKIDIYKKGSFPQYEKCGFVGKITDLLDGDEEALTEIWKKQHSLEAFLKDDVFRPYDELLKKFLAVMGANSLDDVERMIVAGSGDDTTTSTKASKPPRRLDDDARNAQTDDSPPWVKMQDLPVSTPITYADDDESYLAALVSNRGKR